MWEFDHKESWAPKNWCFWIVVLEKSLESILNCKEIKPVNPKGNQPWILIHEKDWCWSWSFNTLAIWCEEPTHWKIPWCWERLKAGGEVDNRGWDGWMALPTQWTWVWVNSRSWWWAGCATVHGVAKSWTRSTRQLTNWTELKWLSKTPVYLPTEYSLDCPYSWLTMVDKKIVTCG